MEQAVSVYVLADPHSEHARALAALWSGAVSPPEPLAELLSPQDLRGEAASFGALPHWTVLDALTVRDPSAFIRAVQRVCRRCAPPRIEPESLEVGPRGKSLVVRCASPALEQVRATLIAATRDLIVRAPLTEEEFSRAAWWIEKVGNQVKDNTGALEEARRIYRTAGSPPLPSSRHFRLGYLVRLVKHVRGGQDQAVAQRHLRYYLERGEPFWYDPPSALLHTTIASGLPGNRPLESFSPQLRQGLGEMVVPFAPAALAVMGEDPEHPALVDVWDSLTETFVREERPGLKVIATAEFASEARSRQEALTRIGEPLATLPPAPGSHDAPAGPAALLVRLEAVKQDPALRPGQRGDRKILVTDLRPDREEPAQEVLWRPPQRSEKCPVLVTKGTEVAVFTQHAKQTRHHHKLATEIYEVLEGEMVIEVEGTLHTLGPGDTIVVKAGACHEVRREGEFLCRVVAVHCGGVSDRHDCPPPGPANGTPLAGRP